MNGREGILKTITYKTQLKSPAIFSVEKAALLPLCVLSKSLIWKMGSLILT